MTELCNACSQSFNYSFPSRGKSGVTRIWNCNRMIKASNSAKCPCQVCLIKTMCQEKCEEFQSYSDKTSWKRLWKRGTLKNKEEIEHAR